MSILEEIDHVMHDLQKSVDAKGNINLANLLAEVVTLFEHLKVELPQRQQEDRAVLMNKIMQLHQFLQSETRRLAAQTGISEEQMLRFAENPDNFSKDQWALLENIKRTMGAQTSDIKKVIQSSEKNIPVKRGRIAKKKRPANRIAKA